MGKAVSVEDVLQNAQSYDGQTLSVEGQFIAMFAGAVISAPRAALELTPDRPRIKLDYDSIEDRCFQVVSPYVGGPWYYNDPATVTGRFVARPEPSLVDLSLLVIDRSGREYRVPL